MPFWRSMRSERGYAGDDDLNNAATVDAEPCATGTRPTLRDSDIVLGVLRFTHDGEAGDGVRPTAPRRGHVRDVSDGSANNG